MLAVEKYLFSNAADPNDKGWEAKRRIVACLVQARTCAIADVAKVLEISIPTVTKLIGELVDEGAVADLGKVETAGGRRPNLFGVIAEGLCLLGTEINGNETDLIISDLHGNILHSETLETLAAEAPEAIARFVTDAGLLRSARNDETLNSKLIAVGIALPCRVNPQTGRTFGMFDEDERPFKTRMEELLQLPVAVETTARAACAAERHAALHVAKTPQEVADNMLYITLGGTIAAAAVVGGTPYSGHSGFAPDIAGNTLIEESAIQAPEATKEFTRNNSTLHSSLSTLIAAARRDDPAAVASIEAAAERAGRKIAQLAQAFNPELVVVGGALAAADDYLMLPLQAAVHRHSAKILYRETRFRTAHVTEHAAAVGATLLTINH